MVNGNWNQQGTDKKIPIHPKMKQTSHWILRCFVNEMRGNVTVFLDIRWKSEYSVWNAGN